MTVSFRMRKPVRNCVITVCQGDHVIKTVRKPKALPAEMIQIPVEREKLNSRDDLEVKVSW